MSSQEVTQVNQALEEWNTGVVTTRGRRPQKQKTVGLTREETMSTRPLREYVQLSLFDERSLSGERPGVITAR